MDFLSLFTGSENLYKYLFIGGLGMLILSVFYPLDDKFKLGSEIDKYNYQVELLNHDIEMLDKNYTRTLSDAKSAEITLTSLKSKNLSRSKRANGLRDSTNRQIAAIVTSRDEISKKQLEINYNLNQIDTLKEHLREYSKYENVFYYGGSFFLIFGFIGWFVLMIQAHIKKGASNP